MSLKIPKAGSTSDEISGSFLMLSYFWLQSWLELRLVPFMGKVHAAIMTTPRRPNFCSLKHFLVQHSSGKFIRMNLGVIKGAKLIFKYSLW